MDNEFGSPKKDLEKIEIAKKEEAKASALIYDRDKNKHYVANDEAVDEIVNDDGYQVIHPNRKIKAD